MESKIGKALKRKCLVAWLDFAGYFFRFKSFEICSKAEEKKNENKKETKPESSVQIARAEGKSGTHNLRNALKCANCYSRTRNRPS